MKSKHARVTHGHCGSINTAVASISDHISLTHDYQALQTLTEKITQISLESKWKLIALDADLSDRFTTGSREHNTQREPREKAMTFEYALACMKAGRTIESGEGGDRIKLQMPWNETAQRYGLQARLVGIKNRLWAPLPGVGADLLSRTDWKIVE